MLKVSQQGLEHLESQYADIADQIRNFEDAELPSCEMCGASDTARVQTGITGRTMNIAAATTKVKLVPNDPPGRCFCNECQEFFD